MGHHRDETYSKESFLPDKASFVAKILQSPIKASKKKKQQQQQQQQQQQENRH